MCLSCMCVRWCTVIARVLIFVSQDPWAHANHIWPNWVKCWVFIIALGFLTTSKTVTIAFYQFKWIQMKEASCHPFITFFSEILFRITLNTTFSPEMQHYSKYRVHTLLGEMKCVELCSLKIQTKIFSQVWKQKSLWKIAMLFSLGT